MCETHRRRRCKKDQTGEEDESLFSKVSTAHQACVSSFMLDQIKSDITDDLLLNYVFVKHLARQTEIC